MKSTKSRSPALRVFTEDGVDERASVTELFDEEIVVDSFADGGGASLGIHMALGRGPDIAINHDAEAIALHKANHPDTEHYIENVWRVDPKTACRGRRVGLMWLSPDCKHFSKAKGGAPVSKKIRGLAWVACRWAKAVRPRVIVLENVEEFQTWGPVLENGQPCPRRKGQTFRAFVRRLEKLGYRVEWKELRASYYNTPTIRKRLFMIARCDGQPIIWPEEENGPRAGVPERVAAECMIWELTCPSIFGRKKPLAANTMRRIARGVKKFVLDNPTPFIVGLGGRMSQSPERPVTSPLQTITAKADSAIIVPHITKFRANSIGHEMTEPMHTVTSNGHNTKRPGCAIPLGLVAPVIVPMSHQNRPTSVEAPMDTVTTQHNKLNLVAPMLIQRYGEREGQAPRTNSVEAPMNTVVTTGNQASLVAAMFMAKHYRENGAQTHGSAMDEPMHTVTSVDHNALVQASFISKMYGTTTGQDVEDPMHTVTANGKAGGHLAEVRAFLASFYNTDQNTGDLNNPIATVTSKDRFALITTAHGVDYEIVDIGMRMLQPRELYRAQGFPDTYKIEVPYDYVVTRVMKVKLKNGKTKKMKVKKIVTKPLTKTAQVRMVGNSVCPPLARAIIAANFQPVARRQERVA